MSVDDIFYFSYGKQIKSFTINQNVSSYSTTASIEVIDYNGSFTSIGELQNNFYFVISIFDISKEDISADKKTKNETGYMFYPYIFDIEKITLLSPEGNPVKNYKIDLLDIISSSLKKVCYGNLLLDYPSFINSNNFGELYTTLMDYAARIIHLSHNKKFHIDKDIFYIDDITDSINPLIKDVILLDLPITMTCYELLNHIHKHAAREVEAPANFHGELVGNVLVPMTLHDEFEDISGHYREYFKRNEDKKIISDISFTSDMGGVSGSLIKRCRYAKTLLMPFQLAFTDKEEKCKIYENINPPVDKDENILDSEKIFDPSNGIVFSPIVESVDLPPDSTLNGLKWKNLALLSECPDGSNNMLIYFNWIYEFYKSAFLNDKNSFLSKKIKQDIVPNIDPHFHVMESAKLVGDDLVSFSRINASTIELKSTDPLKEALYQVGRVIKSYIYLNSMFGFKMKGSFFRHPGEIIKINSATKSIEEEASTGNLGGLSSAKDKYVLMYTTSITHIVDGNTFSDIIYGNKICSFTAPQEN